MSAAYLAAPGDRYGPCVDACAHIDCAETRAMALQTCRLCRRPMGAGVYFYRDDEVAPADLAAGRIAIVHARCLELQAARSRTR